MFELGMYSTCPTTPRACAARVADLQEKHIH